MGTGEYEVYFSGQKPLVVLDANFCCDEDKLLYRNVGATILKIILKMSLCLFLSKSCFVCCLCPLISGVSICSIGLSWLVIDLFPLILHDFSVTRMVYAVLCSSPILCPWTSSQHSENCQQSECWKLLSNLGISALVPSASADSADSVELLD